jgi:hypothetical protein
VFGLHDNPFNPGSFGDVGERALDDISAFPLALDEEPGLRPLFVTEAGPFQRWIDHFEAKLQSGGKGPQGAVRVRSMAFRVVGPEGSGKSTLTNLLVGRLKECVPDGDLLVVNRPLRQRTLEATLEQVRKTVHEGTEKGCCLVFDAVRLDMEEELHSLFEELREEKPVVMFEVIHYGQGVSRPRLASRVVADDLRTTWLTPEHAVAFLGSRIELFRIPDSNPNLVGDLATFPFDAEEIGSVVTSAEGAVETLTLRTLSRLLSRAIEMDRVERRSDGAIAELSESDLRERTISMQDIYQQAIDEPLGESA